MLLKKDVFQASRIPTKCKDFPLTNLLLEIIFFSGLNREAITWASHPNRFHVKAIISDTFCISVVWFKIPIENRGKTKPILFCPQAVVFPAVSHIRACINKEGQRQVRSHHWSCTSYFTFYENRTQLLMNLSFHFLWKQETIAGEPPFPLWSNSFFWKHHTISDPPISLLWNRTPCSQWL